MPLFKKNITTNNKKKIGFLSAILFVIGSCVGAGIFFKARFILNNVHQDFVMSILSWVIAAIAVIAMGVVLIEVASTSIKSDKGVMGWNKIFNSKFTYYASKNFMTFIYVPLTYFFMPVYACQSLLEALNSFGLNVSNVPWWSILLISLLTNFWFIIASGYSSKMGNIQSWMINMVKFFPMVIAAIIGFVIFGLNNNVLPDNIVLPNGGNKHLQPDVFTLQSISPSLGMFCSLSAIFFAYDGFYVASGIQSEMKEPKKTPWAIVIGLLLVTIFYLLIAISSMVGSKTGAWDGFANAFKSNIWKIFYGIFSLFIAFGVFGIVNSYAIWTPRLIESLILDDEFFKLFAKYKHKINLKHPVLGIKISLSMTIPIVIICIIIGALGYIDVGGFTGMVNNKVASLYSFADLSSSWTAVFIFLFIAFAIFGCLRNRKTNKIKVKKVKFFIPLSIISLVIILISLILEIIGPFYKLGYVVSHDVFRNNNILLISSILAIVTLFLYLSGMTIPTYFDFKFQKLTLDKFQI